MNYDFEVDKRPISSWKIARELCAWLVLDLCPTDFDGDMCMSIVASYQKKVKCNGKDKECLSVKQYKTLYKIYTSFQIASIFKKFNDNYKWTCINLTNIGIVKPIQCVETNEKITDVYFEILEQGKYSVVGFEKVFGAHLNHSKFRTESKQETDLITDASDFE